MRFQSNASDEISLLRWRTNLQRKSSSAENIVMPAHDCMDAGVRATQDAKAEAGIHYKSGYSVQWMPACAGMTTFEYCSFDLGLERRNHRYLDQQFGAGEPGLYTGTRRRMPLDNPGIPDLVHLCEIFHVAQINRR